MDSNGRARQFIHGHNRGRLGTGKPDAEVNVFEARARARVRKGTGPCELEDITGCGGRIEVHHLDGNPRNNQDENLMRLCKSHHALVERGRIDLSDPVMPRFEIRGGKRRYEYAYPELFR